MKIVDAASVCMANEGHESAGRETIDDNWFKLFVTNSEGDSNPVAPFARSLKVSQPLHAPEETVAESVAIVARSETFSDLLGLIKKGDTSS